MKSHTVQKIISISRKVKSKYVFPFDQLDVGDKFQTSIASKDRLKGHIQNAQKRWGRKFSMRTIGPKVMVWRVK